MKTHLRKLNILVSALLFLAMTLGLALPVQTARAATLCVNVGGTSGCYATIAAAVAAANPAGGDTINVAAGTYTGNITINKSLTILGNPGDDSPGPGADAPIIDGTPNPGGSGFIIANGVSNVTIKGFEIRNFTSTDTGSGNGIVGWQTSTSNITIQDNYFHDLGWDGVLVGNDTPFAGSHANWTIKGNILETFAAYGFELTNTSNSSIQDNIIHASSPFNPTTCILILAHRDESGITITGNTIDGEMPPWYNGYAAIFVAAGDSGTGVASSSNLTNVDIENNTVSTTGARAQVYLANYTGGTVSGVQMHGNSFTTLWDSTPAAVDATANWWGTADSATIATQIQGSGAANVDYSPWYVDAAKTQLVPVHNVTKDTWYLTIQAAIADANPGGDTIAVSAGTYPERLIISKPLTLSGAGVGLSIIDATSFSTQGSVIDITALTDNTKIEGFDIKTGDKSNGIHFAGGTDAGGKIEILNNHIISTNYNNGDGVDQFGVIGGYGDLRHVIISNNEISNTGDNSILLERHMGASDITGNTLNGAFPTIFLMTYNGNNVTTLQKVSDNTIDFNTAVANSGGSGVAFWPSYYDASNPGSVVHLGRYSNVEISNNVISGLGDLSFKGISIGETSSDCSGGFDALKIFGNDISGTNGKGIQLYGHIANADIHDNTVTGLANGIKAFDYVTTCFPEANNIYHNLISNASTLLVNWTGTSTFTVENNWWGASTGPDPLKMSANVDYTPWCVNQACTSDQPPLPSSFWGYIYFQTGDVAPSPSSMLTAEIGGVAYASVKLTVPTQYAFNVPGDLPGTPGKEGGVDGDTITFKIDGRIVGKGTWLSGTNNRLDFHPPLPLTGGPYVGLVNTAIQLTGSVSDWHTPDTFTYAWELNGDALYDDSAIYNPSWTYTSIGTKNISLKVTDGTTAEGTANTTVSVISVAGLTGQDYDGTAKHVTVTGVDDPLTYKVTYNGSETEPINAGTYPVVITLSNGASFSGINLVINQVSSSITFNCPPSVTYTGSPLTPCTAAAVGAGSLNVPLTVNYANNTNVGTATASAAWGGDINHTGSSDSTTFAITAASATIVSVGNLNPMAPTGPFAATVITSPIGVLTTATYTGVGISYGPSTTPPTTPGTYTVVVSITDPNYTGDPVTVTMHIQTTCDVTGLVAGWNLVSVCLAPVDTTPGTVLSSLSGKYDLVYGWDGSVASNNWLKFAPGGPGYANNMHLLDEKMGFWVHMTAPGSLTVTGYPPVSTSIPLSNTGGGWNLVGYPSLSDMTLAGSLHDFTLIYAYHAGDTTVPYDPWKLFDKSAPSFVNDLTSLTAKWGYWIYVTASYPWTVTY